MKYPFSVILLLVCAIGFVFGIVQLFDLRFDVGDVYPPYSSLRSDPLGTMALFESLGRMSGLTLRRDFGSEPVAGWARQHLFAFGRDRRGMAQAARRSDAGSPALHRWGRPAGDCLSAGNERTIQSDKPSRSTSKTGAPTLQSEREKHLSFSIFKRSMGCGVRI